jgi:hypothetical protein
MAVMFSTCAYFGGKVLADNWVVWALSGGLTFILAVGVAMLAGLSRDLRNPLKKRFGMLRTMFVSR